MSKEKSTKNISIRSQNVQELMNKVPNCIMLWGNLLFLFITLLIFFLSWIIKHPETIQCEAIIKSNSMIYQEYTSSTGTIDSIFIKDGQIVTKNSLILIIKNESFLSNKDYFNIENKKFDTIISKIDSGKIYYIKNCVKGEKIKSGTHLFNITPININTFSAELKVSSQKIRKVKKGQKVKIKLESYPYKDNGFVLGSINEIPNIYDNNEFYTIDIILPKKMITSRGKEIDFKQQIRGSAEIIIKDISLIERFFYQFREVL